MENIKINLNNVQYPPTTQQQIDKDKQLQRTFLMTRAENPLTQEAAMKAVPPETFDPFQVTREMITQAMAFYVNQQYENKEKKSVIVPMTTRRIVADINFKLSASNGEIELSNAELQFLCNVFSSDLPNADAFVYIGSLFLQAQANMNA